MGESLLCNTTPSSSGKNVWLVAQHQLVDSNFPFMVEATGVEFSVDFSSSHHRCCWTRTMLGPLWSSLQEILSPLDEDHRQDLGVAADTPGSIDKDSSLLQKKCTLLHIVSSIRELLKHQRSEQVSRGSVCRLRFVHAVPNVICFGKGISSELCVTLSLRSMRHGSVVMFPSFVAIQPTESTTLFIKLKFINNQCRRATYADGETTLLPLQHIDTESNVATYMPFIVNLSHDASLHADAASLLMEFRIFAAFYASPEDQAMLDESFTNLEEGRSNVTREERFGVLSAEVDPHIIFSTEKRTESKLRRHIKLAMERMDGCPDVKASAASPKASLCPVAALRTQSPVAVQLCAQSGCGTLAALLPKSVRWPLRLRVGDRQSGSGGVTRPIPGSASLERLANELEALHSQLACGEEK